MSERDHPHLTEADLAAACRRESAAVSRIYTAYRPALLRFFVSAVGDRHVTEDLTSAVFAQMIEELPGFRGSVEALGGWLFRIARHVLFDYRRKQARFRIDRLDDVLNEAALAAGPDDPEELAIERLEGSRVMAAIQQLSPDQREVLLLRMAAGLTAPEVAAALHKTTGAVKALQHRGLAHVGRMLGVTRSPLDRVAKEIDDGKAALGEPSHTAQIDETVRNTQAAATSAPPQASAPELKQDPDGQPQIGHRWGSLLRLRGAVAFSRLSLVLMVFSSWSRATADWLVRCAAPQLLPKAYRDRYAQEWSAELTALDGARRAKLGMAVSILVYASSTRRALRRTPTEPKADGEVLVVRGRRGRRLEALVIGAATAAAVFAGLASSLYLPSDPHPSRLQLGSAGLAALLSGALAAWEVWPRRKEKRTTRT
jgi:RNA polymerase sigma-70 factor (ECF subfamily)